MAKAAKQLSRARTSRKSHRAKPPGYVPRYRSPIIRPAKLRCGITAEAVQIAEQLKRIAAGESLGPDVLTTDRNIAIRTALGEAGWSAAKAIGRRGPSADDVATLALIYGLTGSRSAAFILSATILRAAGVRVDMAQRSFGRAHGEYAVRLPKVGRK